MPKINKVAHVVLGCRDPEESIKFYTEVLGMEVVRHFEERNMAFFSFGEQHHDIAVMKVPEDEPIGSQRGPHTALQIAGGVEELAEMYQRLKDHGVEVQRTTDHTLTKSIYFFDPSGNRLEVFCETMVMADAKKYLGDISDDTPLNAPLDLEKASV